MKFSSFSAAALLGLITYARGSPVLESQNKTSPVLETRGKSDKAYLFATFYPKNEQKDDEIDYLDIYTSDDGINFSKDYTGVYTSSKGAVVRDPTITWYGDKYWIAHTNDWYSDSFSLISSSDLKKWEHVTDIKCSTDDLEAFQVWAPEFFVDEADKSVNIIVSIKPKPKSNGNLNPNRPMYTEEHFAPYLLTSKSSDLKTWSSPEALDLHNTGSGKSQGHIDMFVVKDDGGKYHGFMKNEDEKHIEHLESDSLKGTWEYKQTNDFAGWGQMEGPAVARLEDGSWILWMDNYHGTFYYAKSKNLNDWEDKVEMPKWSKSFRHGTMLKQ
ncbi:glycoside hydrolase family 43 protein [Xylariomycetidae sp. FL2044]|nr:glycoside hydrolase family 43 protein [Xylariomycetidae sp. FL2044]